MIINTQTAGRCGNHPPPLCCFWYLVEVIYAFRILLKCSDYKSKFSNIPTDGSVTVTLVQKPDLSKQGITKAVLEFSVKGIEKKGKATVMVNVKTPVENVINAIYSSKNNSKEDLQKSTKKEDATTFETERTVS